MREQTRDSRSAARWALAAFIVTEVITRTVTTVLHLRGAGPNGGLIIYGTHIHHSVFGLTILAILTLVWLARGKARAATPMPLWQPIALGVAWALILDESAMILNMADVYWAPLGDESFLPIVLFAAVLAWLSFRPRPGGGGTR